MFPSKVYDIASIYPKGITLHLSPDSFNRMRIWTLAHDVMKHSIHFAAIINLWLSLLRPCYRFASWVEIYGLCFTVVNYNPLWGDGLRRPRLWLGKWTRYWPVLWDIFRVVTNIMIFGYYFSVFLSVTKYHIFQNEKQIQVFTWTRSFIITHDGLMTWKQFPYDWPFRGGIYCSTIFPSPRAVITELSYFLCCTYGLLVC